jgi:hypothetical protein
VFPAGTGPCQCQFAQWGFFLFDAQGQSGPRTRGHINLWAAGELPGPLSLPPSGTANYNGHAIGNVSNNGARYIAAGNFALQWNFASNNGFAYITNFDGLNLGPTSTPPNVSVANPSINRRDFSGTLVAPGYTGSIAGSFVRGGGNPAAEVIGQFAVNGTNYQAAGIVAGRQ